MHTQKQLFINGRFLTQRISGVQSFAREVCRELMAQKPITILVPANAQLIDDEFANCIKRVGLFGGHLWEQLSLPLFMAQQKNAMLLNLCNTGPLMVNQQIVTIHDLAFLKNPSWFHPVFSKVYSFLIPQLAERSQFIITVSETIKQEIEQKFEVDANKIIVVGNKVSAQLLNSKSIEAFDERIQPQNFFLMVGSDNPRKNFLFVEQIFSEEHVDSKLVIVGGSDKSFNNTTHTENKNIIRLHYTDNSTLLWLYKNAKALINPSLYEGFGIPNIEAMAMGCPVICSDIKVFKEVCGNAAFYFSLDKIDELKNCIAQLNERSELTIEKIHTGKNIFEKYQHENRVAKILKLLEA